MSTLGEIIDIWALPQALTHRFKEWISSEGWILDKPPNKLLYAITEKHLEDAGFDRLVDRLMILTALSPQPGDTSMATSAAEAEAFAQLQAEIDALKSDQEENARERKAFVRAVEATARDVAEMRRSVEGPALLAKATYQWHLVEELAPLDEGLLLQVVADTAEAFGKARQVPLEELAKEDVQKLYVSVLKALHAARPIGSMEPHDTCSGGINEMHRCTADIVVTDCGLPLVAHVVDFYVCKRLLSDWSATRWGDISAKQEAAYEVDEQFRQLLLEQPDRQVFWGCSGGLDCVQLWRMDREGAASRSPVLALACDRNSAGLQAIVRLWCTPASQKGYVAPQLPPPQHAGGSPPA